MFWWANFCRATHHGCVVLLFFVGLLEVVEDRFEWQFWPFSSECDNLAAVVIWGLAIVVMPVKTTFILEYRESRIFVQQTDRPESIHDFTFSRASRAVHSYTIGAKLLRGDTTLQKLFQIVLTVPVATLCRRTLSRICRVYAKGHVSNFYTWSICTSLPIDDAICHPILP